MDLTNHIANDHCMNHQALNPVITNAHRKQINTPIKPNHPRKKPAEHLINQTPSKSQQKQSAHLPPRPNRPRRRRRRTRAVGQSHRRSESITRSLHRPHRTPISNQRELKKKKKHPPQPSLSHTISSPHRRRANLLTHKERPAAGRHRPPKIAIKHSQIKSLGAAAPLTRPRDNIITGSWILSCITVMPSLYPRAAAASGGERSRRAVGGGRICLSVALSAAAGQRREKKRERVRWAGTQGYGGGQGGGTPHQRLLSLSLARCALSRLMLFFLPRRLMLAQALGPAKRRADDG